MIQVNPDQLSDEGPEGKFKRSVLRLIALGAEVTVSRQGNNSLEAHSLPPAEINVTLYSSGGISFRLPCLEIGKYKGEYASKIKEKLGISQDYFEGGGEFSSPLSDPEETAQAFWNAATILNAERLEAIQQVETASREAKKLVTEGAVGRLLAIIQKG